MELSSTRRALLLANIFNLLVAVYFIIIAIVGLAQLRWYHQLTVSVRAHYFITLATSYFAFFILILVGLILVGLCISSSLTLANNSADELVSTAAEDAIDATLADSTAERGETADTGRPGALDNRVKRSSFVLPLRKNHAAGKPAARAVVFRQTSLSAESPASARCSILLHPLVCAGLIVILVFWLYNTGELVRDSIASQLDYAMARYQFTNRSNRFSIAIDGLQDSNNCCGSLDYTDFPHQRVSGLSPGHYPGSCCGKSVFGVNARVLCMAEEVWRAKQTTGCTTVLANQYDLISLLIVPVARVCLFVNITIIALITISKGGGGGGGGNMGGQTTAGHDEMLENMREHRRWRAGRL